MGLTFSLENSKSNRVSYKFQDKTSVELKNNIQKYFTMKKWLSVSKLDRLEYTVKVHKQETINQAVVAEWVNVSINY